MLDRIKSEIEQFNTRAASLSARYECEEVLEHFWRVAPASYDAIAMEDKHTAITILGVTHGNELAGLAVVNELLSLLNSGVFELKFPIAIGLGNPEAAKSNMRFLDVDLNRSFMNNDESSREGKRARELESQLCETHWLLDYHQTLRESVEPFFIFPYTKKGFEFARQIDPARAIVTRWGGSFSAEGGCTDEFVNDRGGCGISYELGQNGFDDYQIALGVRGAMWAIQYATNQLLGIETRDLSQETKVGTVYTFEKTVMFPKEGIPVLNTDLYNFKSIEKSQEIGTLEGQPLLAESSGKMLFPKFLSSDAKLETRPAELYRLLKEIEEADFPD